MILFINGNYPHHSLHGELVSKLADLGHEICVYIPMRGTEFSGKYDYHKQDVKLIYSDVLTNADRVFFLKKIKKLVKDIEEKVDMNQVKCIVAGTVYSDGIPAYLLSKKYNIPFSVTVRETDVSTHLKWRPYLNRIVKNNLKDAYNIILLSPLYSRYFEKFNINASKYYAIPNGINDFWFNNQDKNRAIHTPLSLIYVGDISKRKNVQTSIRVVAELKKRNIDSVFHIIGSGDMEEECHQLASQLGIEKEVHFCGWKNKLTDIKIYYDQADIFIMPSFTETFGTVYIEALSQGLPVIYTNGQGIDGYFEQGSIGYACNPTNVTEIADAIQKIIGNYSSISENCISLSKRFKWDVVAQEYSDLIFKMKEQTE